MGVIARKSERKIIIILTTTNGTQNVEKQAIGIKYRGIRLCILKCADKICSRIKLESTTKHYTHAYLSVLLMSFSI